MVAPIVYKISWRIESYIVTRVVIESESKHDSKPEKNMLKKILKNKNLKKNNSFLVG